MRGLLCGFVALGLALHGTAAAAAATVLECGAIVDLESGERVEDVRIVVDDGAIVAVGPGVQPPAGAAVVDLSGATCLPGLIDLHTHLMITLDRTVTQNFLERTSAEKTLLALRNAQKMLRLGFTTVRIPGDLEMRFANVALRDAFGRGEFLGPRMLVAPGLVGPTGGHSDMNEIATDVFDIRGPVVEAGADNMREEVRRQLKGGADWIKVMATGGVMSQHDDRRSRRSPRRSSGRWPTRRIGTRSGSPRTPTATPASSRRPRPGSTRSSTAP